MAKDKQPYEALSETAGKTVEQNMEKARGAMDKYSDFFQNAMSSYPWGSPEITEKMKTYTEKNISAFVECTRKLTLAKSFQEFFQIQTEFMQTQLSSYTEQARSLGEAYIKAATGATKMTPFGMST